MSKISNTGVRAITHRRLGQFADLSEPTLPRLDDGTIDREALAALSDEEIGALHGELDAYLAELRTTATGPEGVAAVTAIVNGMLALREIAAERLAATPDDGDPDADIAAALALLDAPADPPAVADPPASDPAPAPASGDAATPPQTFVITDEQLRLIVHGPVEAPAAPVTADGAPGGQGLEPLPTPTRGSTTTRTAFAAIRPGTVITAAGDVPDFTSGSEMDGVLDVARALVNKREAIGQPGRMSGQTLDRVARFQAEWPEERHLRKGDSALVVGQKVDAVASHEAIVASGGLCAPVQPYYEIMTLAQASRPVRDSLASFMADRGGIRFVPPPQFADAAGSVGFITAAVDAAALGGNSGQISAATKPCIHASCPTQVEVDLAAVTRCLEFGNLTTRAYPEQVVAWVALAMAQHARKGETALLDGISANSTQVTAARVVGAARDIIAGVVKAAAYYRNHNRMDADATLRVLMPAWVIDLMVADLTHGSGYETEFFAMARREIEDALGELDINVTFYLDSGTGKGQLFNSGAVQAAGALTTFPTAVVWYLFAEGSFLFLDGGTLDFGIVRDSALNALNNYRMFAESFEAVTFVGVESLEVTQTVIADGTAAGAAYGLGGATALPTAY